MKISDLIWRLEEIHEEHGDVEVLVSTDPGDDMYVGVEEPGDGRDEYAVVGLEGDYGRGG